MVEGIDCTTNQYNRKTFALARLYWGRFLSNEHECIPRVVVDTPVEAAAVSVVGSFKLSVVSVVDVSWISDITTEACFARAAFIVIITVGVMMLIPKAVVKTAHHHSCFLLKKAKIISSVSPQGKLYVQPLRSLGV